MKKKSVFGIFLVLLLTGTLTLTSNIQPVGAGQELPIRVGTTDSVEQTLDPAQAYDYFGWCILQQIAGTLVSVKPGSTTGADFVPELAVSWNVSEDLTIWDFNLREGVTFPDGAEFNATHVKYSFDRAIALIPSIPEGAPAGLGYDAIINRIEILDTYKVRFYLNLPFSPFLSILACRASSLVNPNYAPMAKVNYTAGDPRASTPVAFIGPYVLSKWERVAGRDVEIKLDANPNYWNLTSGYPKTKHVIFKFYNDSSSLRLAVEAGDVDMAFRHISPTDVLDLEDNPSVKVWWGKGAFIQYLCFQTKRAPFDDPKVRRAVAAALDRQAVCDTVFLNLSHPLYSIIPPGMLGHTEAFQKLGDANYTLTQSLLAEAGYNETNKLTFELWYESSGHYPSSAEQALLYKEALETSGVIAVTLKSADWASYRRNRNDEIMDAYTYGWYADYVDPDDYAFLYWASWLHTNYHNATQEALYNQARATANITLREELYAQIDEIAAEQCSVVPLYVGSAWAVTHPYINGIYLDITQDMRYWLIYVAEAPRSAGVKAGDWARYSIEANYSTNDPSQPIVPAPGLTEWESLRLTVLSVAGTNVTYEQTIRFENSTEESSVWWIDVNSGQIRYGLTSTGIFIAANLTAGDQVYSNPMAPTINYTVTRFYAGMQREVNYVGATIYYGEIEYLWDRTSGILVELKAEEEYTMGEYRTYFFLHLIMSETNVWSAGLSVNINVTPEALNLKSRGKWITVQIELPDGYKARDVDPSTILLNGTIPPETLFKGKGSSHVFVKFSRQLILNLILQNWTDTGRFGRVTLVVTGRLVDGTPFQGSDTIKTILWMPRGGPGRHTLHI